MPIGAKLRMDGPAGVMVLHEDESRPAVFLAGGIGITPFLAMTRDAAARLLRHQIVLFYSNRRPQDAAFLTELKHMQNRNFRLVATMTEAPEWSGEKRLISGKLLAEQLGLTVERVTHGPLGGDLIIGGRVAEGRIAALGRLLHGRPRRDEDHFGVLQAGGDFVEVEVAGRQPAD